MSLLGVQGCPRCLVLLQRVQKCLNSMFSGTEGHQGGEYTTPLMELTSCNHSSCVCVCVCVCVCIYLSIYLQHVTLCWKCNLLYQTSEPSATSQVSEFSQFEVSPGQSHLCTCFSAVSGNFGAKDLLVGKGFDLGHSCPGPRDQDSGGPRAA